MNRVGEPPRSSPFSGEAERIMDAFALRTGVEGVATPRRYLWTDAFAVTNDLCLALETGRDGYVDRARRLVDQVHHILGRHRPDDERRGWLSRLGEADAELHPTRGGLRIGKELPERRVGEPQDPVSEWSRDGQYFHYLTRWMHALDQLARATGDARYNRWARELAEVACDAFTVRDEAGRALRLRWKMSIELDRPLVDSTGQHDALDGLLTCLSARATAARWRGGIDGPGLEGEIAELSAMAAGGGWATADPLGIGGLLMDAIRALDLVADGIPGEATALPVALLEAAHAGLDALTRHDGIAGPAERRLAFRELGLAIGLAALERVEAAYPRLGLDRSLSARLATVLDALRPHRPLADEIERFWARPESRRARSWIEHIDIDEVMLATRMLPLGALPHPLSPALAAAGGRP